jgi:hypothetical protein
LKIDLKINIGHTQLLGLSDEKVMGKQSGYSGFFAILRYSLVKIAASH